MKIIKEKNGLGETRYRIKLFPLIGFLMISSSLVIGLMLLLKGVLNNINTISELVNIGNGNYAIISSLLFIMGFIIMGIESSPIIFDTLEEATYYLKNKTDKDNNWKKENLE